MNPSLSASANGPNLSALQAAGTDARTAGCTAQARITSQALMGGRQELLIVHQGREYRLRITQNGKLILTA